MGNESVALALEMKSSRALISGSLIISPEPETQINTHSHNIHFNQQLSSVKSYITSNTLPVEHLKL